MNKKELLKLLQHFKQECDNQGCTVNKLYLDDAYVGIQPTSFIVRVVATDWLQHIDSVEALNKLTDILWQTTDAKTRESIFTISICGENEIVRFCSSLELQNSCELGRCRKSGYPE